MINSSNNLKKGGILTIRRIVEKGNIDGFNYKIVLIDVKLPVISLFYCGYVEIPREHPLYGKYYDDKKVEELDVHGGITFAGQDIDTGKGWWIGFDCAHFGDNIHVQNREYVRNEIKSLIEQLKEIR